MLCERSGEAGLAHVGSRDLRKGSDYNILI
jgi:hypothetical protein